MEKIAVLVSDLKVDFSEIEYRKFLFEQYGLACFDKEENSNLVYLEIILLENIDIFCFDEISLEKIFLRNYKSIIDLDSNPLNSVNNLKIINNNTIQIVEDNWDQIDW